MHDLMSLFLSLSSKYVSTYRLTLSFRYAPSPAKAASDCEQTGFHYAISIRYLLLLLSQVLAHARDGAARAHAETHDVHLQIHLRLPNPIEGGVFTFPWLCRQISGPVVR